MRSKNYKESDWGLDIDLLTTQGMRFVIKSMDPLGCTKGVLIVLRGYKIYVRYKYYFFKFVKILGILFIVS